jgi:osmotically-inducible protein OsmY
MASKNCDRSFFADEAFPHSNSDLLPVNFRMISRIRSHDRAIRESVNQVLQQSGYASLRCIQCDVSDGVVELTGNVPSFYVKQLAQTAVLRLEQIRGVKNLLRVA